MQLEFIDSKGNIYKANETRFLELVKDDKIWCEISSVYKNWIKSSDRQSPIPFKCESDQLIEPYHVLFSFINTGIVNYEDLPKFNIDCYLDIDYLSNFFTFEKVFIQSIVGQQRITALRNAVKRSKSIPINMVEFLLAKFFETCLECVKRRHLMHSKLVLSIEVVSSQNDSAHHLRISDNNSLDESNDIISIQKKRYEYKYPATTLFAQIFESPQGKDLISFLSLNSTKQVGSAIVIDIDIEYYVRWITPKLGKTSFNEIKTHIKGIEKQREAVVSRLSPIIIDLLTQTTIATGKIMQYVIFVPKFVQNAAKRGVESVEIFVEVNNERLKDPIISFIKKQPVIHMKDLVIDMFKLAEFVELVIFSFLDHDALGRLKCILATDMQKHFPDFKDLTVDDSKIEINNERIICLQVNIPDND